MQPVLCKVRYSSKSHLGLLENIWKSKSRRRHFTFLVLAPSQQGLEPSAPDSGTHWGQHHHQLHWQCLGVLEQTVLPHRYARAKFLQNLRVLLVVLLAMLLEVLQCLWSKVCIEGTCSCWRHYLYSVSTRVYP